ncbi:Cytosine/adenosine deaminase (plasmid) [Legionella adelaidensis]|uniref:Bifunctional uridylyltransferase/uridylyl-removing enzyme n=1 Tax=Legionella adelaidensis TaxID=45056 RepID=A0A0W0R4L0_9GAMM|nr:[protein-PII] uridylyltransferase [Legionella adelaidensis]KTC65977.1 protein-PII uridylyltransferase [Legionella adelaidensis]VEH86301.1 Cytosine/adenosine deaminase [Legionella adelaidensis]
MCSLKIKDDSANGHPLNQEKNAVKKQITSFHQYLENSFYQKRNIIHLIQELSDFTDSILIEIGTHHHLFSSLDFCFLALGSYGRRELSLYSDIDLLILHEEEITSEKLEALERFIQDCWGLGLEIGHQITTVSACSQLAAQDLSVISNILDVRFLFGNKQLMEALIYATHTSQMWPSDNFYFAKHQEQIQRYKKYGETAYNLEPNIKNGPGGLRDIHTILAVAKRHFAIQTLEAGIECGFLTEKEYQELLNCQQFLWRIRFALHLIAQKREDRLLFDYQVQLANLFGYEDNDHSLAIEQFMKDYFKIIKRNRELNEILLQWFEEVIILPPHQPLLPLDEYFHQCNNYIEVKNNHVFSRYPHTILTLFLWLVKNPHIIGVRANTIRSLHENLHFINGGFRENSTNIAIFLELFKQENGPFEALQRMSRYGVLGKYLPCFEAVTGQMQYDLFHVYTVDQHTLFVIRNLGRFLNPSYARQFPLAAKLMSKIKAKEILYLAAFFHDIGKGRGGDHSDLGAKEAIAFSLIHRLEEDKQALFVWLVKNHLLMSLTAQREDIYDLRNVKNFCNQLPHPQYLDYLYLLTVADICATNPNLWNAWKDSLLKELYLGAKRLLEQTQAPTNEEELINFKKRNALQIILGQGFALADIQNLWQNFKGKYFLHESPELIAKQTQAILSAKKFPVVLIMPHHNQGGTEVFVYSPHIDSRFTITTTVLNNHHVTIQEANIITCDNQFDLDTYIILDENNKPLETESRIEQLKEDLENNLSNPLHLPHITRKRISRTQAHFKIKPEIIISEDERHLTTCLFLKTSDRPGLLASISRIFFKEQIHLHHAKIATAGECVEDMFYITSKAGKPLTGLEKEMLKKKMVEGLNE